MNQERAVNGKTIRESTSYTSILILSHHPTSLYAHQILQAQNNRESGDLGDFSKVSGQQSDEKSPGT